jgi:Chaperone of endosialidase
VYDNEYRDGEYRYRFLSVDRSNNLSLYLQESLNSTTNFSNLVRFGLNKYDTNTFAVFGTMVADAYFHTSDERLKTNIHPIDHALDKVLALKGIEFNWKKGGRADMGVTAQNVATVFPNVVSKNGDGAMSVEYDSLAGPMIEAIRELKADNDELRSELTGIKQSLKAKETPSVHND